MKRDLKQATNKFEMTSSTNPAQEKASQVTDKTVFPPPANSSKSINLTMAYYANGDEQFQELQEIPVEQQTEERLVEALGYHVQDSVNWALIQALKPFTKPLTNFGRRKFLAKAASSLGRILGILKGFQAPLSNAPEVLPLKKYWREWQPWCCVITNTGLPHPKRHLFPRPRQAFMNPLHPNQSLRTRKRIPFRVRNCEKHNIPQRTQMLRLELLTRHREFFRRIPQVQFKFPTRNQPTDFLQAEAYRLLVDGAQACHIKRQRPPKFH
ncbi:hypothetical protein NDU88_003460 [Pleurodeles waltl]|uniref:Uncharacterized protein n=1 Tax=Pleurodeles waltl TaxID=8319 RepID=A0AAV7QBS6_PLEWA|nr:hypothetical protein NDU88_003460 [Pleurodeles waltl]